MIIDDVIRELHSRFKNTGRISALNKLARELERVPAMPHVEEFLRMLEFATQTSTDQQKIEQRFDETAEQYLCKGAHCIDAHDPVIRVVTVSCFLSYYSKRFILLGDGIRQRRVEKYIPTLRAMFTKVDKDNLQAFLDKELKVTGRLRRNGFALWLTPQTEVSSCLNFAAYRRRLALSKQDKGPAFCVCIGYKHLGNTPNIRNGVEGHDAAQTMSLHLPSLLDGMHYPRFRPGGYTTGRAREFVSRLDNTDAIDRLEWIE